MWDHQRNDPTRWNMYKTAATAPVCEHDGHLQWYLYVEGHKRHKAVVLDDLCQLFIQKAELFEKGVSSQVIEKISQVHDLCVEVQVEGCTRLQTGKKVTLLWKGQIQ